MSDTDAPLTVPNADPLAVARHRANAALGVMGNTNPDEHATALKLAGKLGADPRAAAAALRARPQQATDIANGADQALKTTRSLPRWATDPHNAAMGRDHMANLAALEHAVTSHKEHTAILMPAGAAGYYDAKVGTDVLAAIVLNQPADWAAANIAQAERTRRAIEGLRPGGIKGYAFDALRGLAGMAPAIAGSFAGGAAGFATGLPVAGGLGALATVSGPAAPLFAGGAAFVEAQSATIGARTGLFVGLGVTSAGGLASGLLGSEVDLTDEAAVAAWLGNPENVKRVRNAAFRGGAVNASLMLALQGLYPPGASFGKAGAGVLPKAVAAGKEMALQTVTMAASNLAGHYAATGKLPTDEEVNAELVAAAGAALPFVVHGGVEAARHAEVRRGEAHDARLAEIMAVADHASLTEAVAAAGESKVRTRNQERFESLAKLAADDAEVPTVYVNREGWDAVQTGAGKAPAVEAERLTGGRRAYDEALRTGVLEVPYERALSMLPDDPLAPALLEHATVRPGGLTIKEAEAAGKAREKAAAEVPEAEAVPDPEMVAQDETRAAELEAKLGVPEGAGLLFQAERDVSTAGQDAGPNSGQPDSGTAQTDVTREPDVSQVGPKPKVGTDPLRAAADAIEAAKPAGIIGRLTGAEPVADAVRKALGSEAGSAAGRTAIAPDSASAQVLSQRSAPGEGQATSGSPQGLPFTEALAAAAQRDPAGTAAALRELADINDRRAKVASPEVALRGKLTAAIRAAGRPAREANAVATVLADFVTAIKARAPEVADKLDAMMVRFAKGKAPDGSRQQGEAGAYDPAARVIHLFENANATTAIHEASHWEVDVLHALASDPDAPPALREMYDALTDAAGAERGAKLTTAQHERIAEAFVGYLYTGKAPSAGLHRAFATMRDVMLRVYESVKQYIGVDKLSPELRAVFDRMHATDVEIAAAEAEHGAPVLTREEAAAASKNDPAVMALFDANQKALAAAGDEAREKLASKMLKEIQDEQAARRAAILENLKAEEGAKFDASPAGVAHARMHDDIKLDRETLRTEYGADVLKRLDKAGVVADDGLSAQAAAEVFGFRSPGELLGVLMTDRDALVSAAARQRLATEHTELYRDVQARRVEARKIVAEVDRGKIIEAEIRALKALDRAAQPAEKSAERVARGDERLQAAVEKAARAASEEKKAKAAYDEAFKAGHEEGRAPVADLLAELDQARTDAAIARAAADAQVTAMRSQSRAKAAAEESQRRAAYDAIPTTEDARAVAREKIARMPVGEIKPYQYRMAERKARTTARDRALVGDHLEAAQALGNALVYSEMHREAVKTAEQALKDTKAITATQRDTKQVALGKAGGEWRNQVNMLAARFGLGKIRPDEAEVTTPIADWLAALDAQAGTEGNVFLPFVADWIKAEKANDWTKLTGEQLHDLRISIESIADIGSERSRAHAKGAEDSLLDRTAAVVAQVEASHPKLTRDYQATPTWGQNFAAEHSPIDRYVYEIDGGPGGPLAKAILFPRNEGEAELEQRRVRANKSWKPAFAEFTAAEKATMGRKEAVEGVRRKLSHENCLMIVLYEGHESGRQQNRNTFTEAELDAIKRTMTPADAHWLNETWRFGNEDWPELRDHMQRNYGVVPPKVEAIPFKIGDLSLTGGYSKIKHFGERAAQQTIEEIAGDLARGAAVRSTVRLGARFERQQNVTRELRYDFGVVMEGKAEAMTALALTERLYDINYVLRQQSVRDAIVERHGQEVYDQFKASMAALAGGHLKRQSSGEQLANYLRTGTIIAKLGFKVGTQVLNATGIANSVEGLGPEVLKEAAQLSLDPAGFRAAVKEMWAESSTMETRGVSASREQVDIQATLNKRFDTDFLRQLPMLPMAGVQLWVDLPTYRVAKRKALAEGHSAKDAIRIAEQAVKDYQGSGFPADMPAIMRDHKYMTLFMGFLNRTINLGVRRVNMTPKDTAGLLRIGATAVILFGLPAAVQQAYNRYARGDDNEDPFWWSTAQDAALSPLGGVAWARDLVAAARYESYGGPGSLSVLADFGKAARGVGDAEISERDMQSIVSLAGTLAWLPTAQAIEMWRGLEAALEGDAQPTAVVTGPPRTIR